MKGKKFKKDDRKYIFDKFNDYFSQLSTAQSKFQEEWENEAFNNNSYFRRKINDFYISRDSNFKELKNDLKQLQGKLKGTKLQKDDRNYIYNKLNDIFHNIKSMQEQVYQEKQKLWKDRFKKSISKLESKISSFSDSIWYDENKLNDMQYKTVPDKWRHEHNERMNNLRDKIYSKKNKLSDMKSSLSEMRSKL